MIFSEKSAAILPDLPSQPNAPSDAELAAAALGGDEAAFALLLERYRPLLWRVAWRLALDSDDAWDVCQEVVIRVWRALPRYRPGEPFAPWLRVIAVREALRWLRRDRHGPHAIPLEAVAEILPIASGPLGHAPDRLAAEDDRRRLATALGALSPQQRTAVTLRFYEEMTLAEIAEAMECSEGTVKQHLFRAMEKLRQTLGGRSGRERH
jgi:RNA polymerase sigma-70 factor (ECF subfamily)